MSTRFVGKHEGKRPLGRLKHRWEDTIKTDYKEIGWKGMDLIHLPQDRNKVQALVKMIVKLWFYKMLGIS
jgi:hypothetical protein